MANIAVKFYKVASLPASGSLVAGAIYFVTGTGGTGATVNAGDIYVATSTTETIKYTSDVQSVTFADSTSGSPYTGGALTVTNKYGVSTTYNVASQEDLSALAAAMSAAIADLDVNGYAQASVAAGSGTPANSAVVTISGIKEEDGKISADSTNNTAVTIAGGNNITVTTSGNTITIAGENGGVQSIQAGTGIEVTTSGSPASAESPVVSINGDFVNGTLSDSNKLATQSTVTTAIGALDGSATIASKSGDVVTIKTGVTETDGVISNDSGTDIVLEEIAVTGAADDVSIADTAGKYTATTVEGALAELEDVAHSGAAADVSIADSGSKFNATDVEGALAELKDDIAAINQFEYVVAQTLPTASADTMYKIYLIPQSGTPSTPNVYDEYITIASGSPASSYSWELFGTTQVDISTKADKVSGATNGNFAGLDSNGNLTDSGSKASDFKTVQTAVADPTASGTSITFIDSISQDTNGVITPTKKTVADAVASTSGAGGSSGLMSATDKEKLDGVATGAQVNVLEGVQINGTDLTITNKKVNIVTSSTHPYNETTNPVATMDDIAAANLCWEQFD